MGLVTAREYASPAPGVTAVARRAHIPYSCRTPMLCRAVFASLGLLACRRDPPPAPRPVARVDAAAPRDVAAPPCPANDLPRCRTLALEAIRANDDGRAADLARFACGAGHLPACRTLAWLMENGRGGPRDLPRARTLYQRACDGGELESCKNLAFLFDTSVPPDRARAAPLYQRACDGGVLEACNNLANLYLGGDGVARDLERAIALYDRVCAAGNHERACGNATALRAQRDRGVADAARR